MKIPFAEIAKNGSQYNITSDDWLNETGLLRIAPVQAELLLSRKGDLRAEVQGALRTGVRLACDRCAAEYDFAIDAAFHLVLEVPADQGISSLKDLESAAAKMDVIELDEPVADLADILRQQLYLSLPIKQVCSPDCQGLCPHCGVDLNLGGCTCSSEVKNSPFAALAAFKKR